MAIDGDALLSKLEGYKDEGQSYMDSWRTERDDGIAVWEGKFTSGSEPADAFYYPVVYSRLRHYVRAARGTYTSAQDLLSVMPEGKMATEWEQKVSELQREEMNYHISRWSDWLVFIDDSMTQGLKIGVCAGKVWWERQTVKEIFLEEQPPHFEFDEEGETVRVQPEPIEREREGIVVNKLMIDHISLDGEEPDLIWDTTATKWSEAKWAIHRNIEVTEDELWRRVDEEGYNRAAVEMLVNGGDQSSGDDEADDPEPELEVFKIAEFWGEIDLKPMDEEHKVRTEFVKIVMDNQFKYILKDPDKNVYKYADSGEPFLPFEVGYLVRREGEVRGESFCYKMRDFQAEINCIRNQRRESVQNDLNERYVVRSDVDWDFSSMGDSKHAEVMTVSDMDGFKEVRHWDNTRTSYNELEMVDRDMEKIDGISPYVLGQADPSITDTLGGIQIMSTHANTVVYDVIVSFNQYLENLLTKGLHMSLQYLTVQELEAEGLNLPTDIRREDMKRRLRLRLDTGVGATSEQVEINNKTRSMFMSMSVADWMEQKGVEIGPMRYLPADFLRDLLPLMNIKDKMGIPTSEEFEQMTQQMVDYMRGQEQQQANAIGQEVNQAAQQGAEAGAQAAPELLAQETENAG